MSLERLGRRWCGEWGTAQGLGICPLLCHDKHLQKIWEGVWLVTMHSPVFSPDLRMTTATGEQWHQEGKHTTQQWAVLGRLILSPLGNPSCRGDPTL